MRYCTGFGRREPEHAETARPATSTDGGGDFVKTTDRTTGRHTFNPYARLTEPLIRERGVLRPASWDEALDRAAEGFRTVRDTKGPNSVGVFSCSKSTNEMNYVAQKFIRVAIGSNNIDSCNRT